MSAVTPTSVVKAALMQPVPCPECGGTKPCRCLTATGARLDWQADLIVQALAAAGLLTATQDTTPDDSDIEDTARWLAEQSRHPRYVAVTDGWRQLLDSEANIGHAYRAAMQTHPGSSDVEKALARARDDLLHHTTLRRAAGTEG